MACGVTNTAAWSHSLPAVCVLAAAFAALTLALRHCKKDAAVVALVCLSHVAVDYLTGHKPLWLGGPVVGLGLYKYQLIDFVIESAVVVVGWAMYFRTLPDTRRSKRPIAIGLLCLLLSMQAVFDWKFAGPGQ